MSTTRTGVLAAVFLLLAGYFLIFEGISVERPLPEWERAEKIVRCDDDPPSRLEVSSQGQTTAAAERSAGGWRVTPARKAIHGEQAFADLAGALCTLPVIETIPDPGALSEFGLDDPEVEVAVEAGGKRRVLQLGDFSPARNFLYGKWKDSSELLKLGALLRSEVDKVLRYATVPGQVAAEVEDGAAAEAGEARSP